MEDKPKMTWIAQPAQKNCSQASDLEACFDKDSFPLGALPCDDQECGKARNGSSSPMDPTCLPCAETPMPQMFFLATPRPI